MKLYEPQMTSLISEGVNAPGHHYSLTIESVDCPLHLVARTISSPIASSVSSVLILLNFSAKGSQLLLDKPSSVLAGMCVCVYIWMDG